MTTPAPSLYGQRIKDSYEDILHLGNGGAGLTNTTPIPLRTGAGDPLVLEVAPGELYLTPGSTIDGGGNYLQAVILDGGAY